MLWACDPLGIVLLGQTRPLFRIGPLLPDKESSLLIQVHVQSLPHSLMLNCNIAEQISRDACMWGPPGSENKIYLVMWGAFEVKWQERKGWHIRCGRVFCDKIIKYIYIEQKLGNKILSIKSLSLEWIQKPLCCDMVYHLPSWSSHIQSLPGQNPILRKSFPHLPLSYRRWPGLNVVNTESDSRATNIYLPTPGEDRSFSTYLPVSSSSLGSWLSPCAILIGSVSWCNNSPSALVVAHLVADVIWLVARIDNHQCYGYWIHIHNGL